MARLIVVLSVVLQVLAATANTDDVIILLGNQTTETTTTTEATTTTTTTTPGVIDIGGLGDHTTTTTSVVIDFGGLGDLSTTVASSTTTTSTTVTDTTSTTGSTAGKFVSQGTVNLTMSSQDVEELTSDIAKARKVLGAAIASTVGLEASEVTVTKVYVDGERKFRRLEGVTGSSIDVEFQIVSTKPPATNVKASELKAAIESQAQAEGLDVTVESVESNVVIVSSPSVPAEPEEDSSSVAIVLTVLSVCLVSFGLIGGLIYWYYRYSASTKAGLHSAAPALPPPDHAPPAESDMV